MLSPVNSSVGFAQLVYHAIGVLGGNPIGAVLVSSSPDEFGGRRPVEVFLAHRVVFAFEIFDATAFPMRVPPPAEHVFPHPMGHAPSRDCALVLATSSQLGTVVVRLTPLP